MNKDVIVLNHKSLNFLNKALSYMKLNLREEELELWVLFMIMDLFILMISLWQLLIDLNMQLKISKLIVKTIDVLWELLLKQWVISTSEKKWTQITKEFSQLKMTKVVIWDGICTESHSKKMMSLTGATMIPIKRMLLHFFMQISSFLRLGMFILMLPNSKKDTYGWMEETWEGIGPKGLKIDYFVLEFGSKMEQIVFMSLSFIMMVVIRVLAVKNHSNQYKKKDLKNIFNDVIYVKIIQLWVSKKKINIKYIVFLMKKIFL